MQAKMAYPNGTILFICIMAITMALTPHLSNAHGDSPQDYVDAHNAVRAEFDLPPFIWDDEIAKYARDYAETRSEDCQMVHSNGPFGENIAQAPVDITAKQAVDAWAAEKKFYDYKSNTCVGGECKHYVQIVWRDTGLVGCAKTKCTNNGATYIVCSYEPAGNYVDERPY